MTPIFYIKGGNLSFADNVILSDIELFISPGDRVCLVGKNGCGKSSLMKVIQGDYELDEGGTFQEPGIHVGYLKQDMKSLPSGTIYDFILNEFDDPMANRYLADIILKQLEIDGESELKNCSGGQIRRVCLAKSLVSQPDILLLDEPTNHLDIQVIEWLEGYINSYKGAVVCISHDRKFQENITNKVWWLDRGVLRKSSRGFRYYDEWREEIIASEEASLRKMNRKLEVEKDWLQGGVTGRRKRNQQRLSNLYKLRDSLRDHESHLRQAKEKMQIQLAEEARQTKFIIEAENISYNFHGKTLFNDFNFKVKKGEKIGVIGPNGVGKSTLIKLLVKELEPMLGKVKHGTNIEVSYFDQHRSDLNPAHSLKKTLCPGGGDQIFLQDRSMHVATYLKQFMFDPKMLDNKVSTLSGGEANRLLLAKALINPGNLFILDEPTNDLDMDSLEMLLEILADYTGTLIVVSHDRDFLERLVTRTLVFANNKIIDLYGGYDDYLKYHKTDLKQAREKNKTPAKVTIAQPVKKLSYKYMRLLETLPGAIESLESKIKLIEQQLSIPGLYNENNKRFNQLSQDLESSQKDLDDKLEQWLEVEMMQEEINK